jgi:hypothetical protein
LSSPSSCQEIVTNTSSFLTQTFAKISPIHTDFLTPRPSFAPINSPPSCNLFPSKTLTNSAPRLPNFYLAAATIVGAQRYMSLSIRNLQTF